MNRGVGWIAAGLVLGITAGPRLLLYGRDVDALLVLTLAALWASVGLLLQLAYRPTAWVLEREGRR